MWPTGQMRNLASVESLFEPSKNKKRPPSILASERSFSCFNASPRPCRPFCSCNVQRKSSLKNGACLWNDDCGIFWVLYSSSSPETMFRVVCFCQIITHNLWFWLLAGRLWVEGNEFIPALAWRFNIASTFFVAKYFFCASILRD